MVEIIPSILTSSALELQQLLSECEGKVERVHIDIIDGQFVNNKTIDPTLVQNVETDLLLDYHLMTKEPISWLERCVRGQADRAIGHVELMEDQIKFVEKASDLGVKVGLAIDLDTPVSKIDETIISDIDVVLVMSVKAGFGGQKFMTKALEKIKDLHSIQKKDKTPFSICVDGGITPEIVKDLEKEGVNAVAVGAHRLAEFL